ncbi:MAG: hypothetical protein WD425_17410 [Nitrospirales bacterium]
MLISQFVLAATFLVLGSSVVLAEDSSTRPVEKVNVEESPVLSAEAQRSKTMQEKWDFLASKYEELEAKMARLSPEESSQQEESALNKNPYDPQVDRTMQGWSSMDHLAEAKVSQQEAAILERRVQKLQNRIDEFSQKPYLDTKGFKRSGLKILKGNLTQELRETTQKTAWHTLQAKTIMLSESNHQERS